MMLYNNMIYDFMLNIISDLFSMKLFFIFRKQASKFVYVLHRDKLTLILNLHP